MSRFVSIFLAIVVACFLSVPVQSADQPGKSAPVKVVKAQQVNINTASADMLAETLKGIGPAKAEAIVAWRKANGPFKQIEDLLNVKGIGESTLKKNAPYLRLK